MIELNDLQKVIEKNTILDLNALNVGSGEIAGLVGPVDSGLEALFELLTGKTRPTAGIVRLDGIDPFKNREQFSHQIGILFSEDNLYKRQSVEWNLKFYGRLHRLPKDRIQKVLTLVGLADHANIIVEKLPSSLARRLAFGRAILHQPRVLLLVEPFAKCDDVSITLMSKLIRQLADDEAAILIMAGDTNNLESLCDTIYRLEQGRIVDAYKPEDKLRPDLPFMIPVRLEGKVALVDPADILYVVASEDRASLQTADDLIPTQFTLKDLETRLARSGFFRAHRSYLVNLQQVKEVIPYTRNSFSLRLKDSAGTKIPLSKAAANELRNLLGY